MWVSDALPVLRYLHSSRTRLAAMESINKVLRERVVADHLTGR